MAKGSAVKFLVEGLGFQKRTTENASKGQMGLLQGLGLLLDSGLEFAMQCLCPISSVAMLK